MNTEALIWILFIIFLVASNIASYKMGYTRGLLKGILTSELLRLRETTELEVSRMMWHGDPEVENKFEGLHPQDFLTAHPLEYPVQEKE
jgi:hypothetical protein